MIAEFSSDLAFSITLLINSLFIIPSVASLIKLLNGNLSSSGYSSKYFAVRWFRLILG
jgi:hypothetical protein